MTLYRLSYKDKLGTVLLICDVIGSVDRSQPHPKIYIGVGIQDFFVSPRLMESIIGFRVVTVLISLLKFRS